MRMDARRVSRLPTVQAVPSATAAPWTVPHDDEDRARRVAAWAGVRNLLVVRLDNLGDVLMTTPALRAIRQSLPAARITLLASPAGAAAADAVPLVDEVITCQAAWVKAPAQAQAPLGAAERALVDTLAQGRFDACVIFTVHSQSALPAALLATLAGIALRLAHCRENPYGLLSDWVRDPEPQAIQRHEVERQLALVAHVGCATTDDRLHFTLPPSAVRSAHRKMLRAGVDRRRPYVVVHPGASAPSRRWPAVDFARAADLLAFDHQIVLVGGAADAPLVDTMLAAMQSPAAVLVDDLSLTELGVLISGARVVLCNNSAPAHIAAALGTPVVVLYALTNGQHTPWRVPARVLYRDVPCRNCMRSECPLGHHECLLGVRPAQVAAAARELTASWRMPPIQNAERLPRVAAASAPAPAPAPALARQADPTAAE